jgi:hypothetical protein
MLIILIQYRRRQVVHHESLQNGTPFVLEPFQKPDLVNGGRSRVAGFELFKVWQGDRAGENGAQNSAQLLCHSSWHQTQGPFEGLAKRPGERARLERRQANLLTHLSCPQSQKGKSFQGYEE